MPELRIPLDPCNPGQFYACCGLIELLELYKPGALSRYVVDTRLPRKATLIVESEAPIDVAEMVNLLQKGQCEVVPRHGLDAKPKTSPSGGDRARSKDSTAPLLIHLPGEETIVLDWWLDEFWNDSSKLKLWAGNQGSFQIWAQVCELLPTEADPVTIFNLSKMATGRFGVDPRSAWEALDLGYSHNEQNHPVRTYPAVEILAAIGLQGFRPRGARRPSLKYSLWQTSLPAAVARTGCVQPWDGLSSVAYHYRMEGRGSYKYFSFAEKATSAQE